MAIVINGTGTIAGVSAGGLPDNCITADDLATTLDLSDNTITLPSGTGGKILQVVQSSYDTMVYSTSATHADTGLSASITPSSTSSKILIIVSQSFGGSCGSSRNNATPAFRIVRGTTDLENYSTRLDNITNMFVVTPSAFQYLDSPSTTSSTTYKTTYAIPGADGRYAFCQYESASHMTLMEIAG